MILSKTISNACKMDEMKTDLCYKISTMNENLSRQIKGVDDRVTSVKDSCDANTEDIKTVNSELLLLKDEVKTLKMNEICRDVHSRRYNLVAGNITDQRGWETPGTSMAKKCGSF